MELQVDDGKVSDVRFSGKGCAIRQASASMLTETIKGKKLEEVAHLSNDVVLENVGIGISPTRMKCAMLGLRSSRARRSAKSPPGPTKTKEGAGEP